MKMFGQCTIRLLSCFEKCFLFISLFIYFILFYFFSFAIFLFLSIFFFSFSVLSDLEVNQPAFPV